MYGLRELELGELLFGSGSIRTAWKTMADLGSQALLRERQEIWLSRAVEVGAKKGRPNHDRSYHPDQGAKETAHGRTPPFRGANGQHCILWIQEPFPAQVGRLVRSRTDDCSSSQFVKVAGSATFNPNSSPVVQMVQRRPLKHGGRIIKWN